MNIFKTTLLAIVSMLGSLTSVQAKDFLNLPQFPTIRAPRYFQCQIDDKSQQYLLGLIKDNPKLSLNSVQFNQSPIMQLAHNDLFKSLNQLYGIQVFVNPSASPNTGIFAIDYLNKRILMGYKNKNEFLWDTQENLINGYDSEVATMNRPVGTLTLSFSNYTTLLADTATGFVGMSRNIVFSDNVRENMKKWYGISLPYRINEDFRCVEKLIKK